MSKSVIVELSEQGDNSQNYDNGDYKTTIDPIMLEKGDQVLVKSAFIDSIKASNENIRQVVVNETVPNTGICDVVVKFGYYYLDWGSSQETVGSPSKTFVKYQNNDAAPPVASTGPHVARSGLPYILNYPNTAPHDNIQLLEEFTIQHSPPRTFGNNKNRLYEYSVVISYEGWDDATSSFKAQYWGYTLTGSESEMGKYSIANHQITWTPALIAEAQANGDIAQYKDPNWLGGLGTPVPVLSLKVKKGLIMDQVFTAVTTGDQGAGIYNSFGGIIGAGVFNPIVQTDTIYQMYESQIAFSIPAKTYQAADIADLISTKMTDINAMGTGIHVEDYILGNNPMLKTVRQLLQAQPFKKGDDPGNNTQPTFFSQERDNTYNSFTFTTPLAPDAPGVTPLTQNYLLGSSQFSMSYDPEHDKMVLAQIHNHLYSDTDLSANQPQVRALKTAAGTTFVNKVGGIFLTGLSPPHLWTGVDSSFKFGDSILPSKVIKRGLKLQADNITVATGTVQFEDYNLIDGINVTGDDMGLDTFIKKNRTLITPAAGGTPAVYSSGFDVVQPFINTDSLGQEVIPTVVGDTIKIRSLNTLSEANDVDVIKKDGGFFKLEISMPSIRQDLIQADSTNTNIQAVIGRFYQAASYTSAYNEGSIPYIYDGDEPVLLSDFKVRILQPDGSLATDLGKTSTIFMEVIKAVPEAQ